MKLLVAVSSRNVRLIQVNTRLGLQKTVNTFENWSSEYGLRLVIISVVQLFASLVIFQIMYKPSLPST